MLLCASWQKLLFLPPPEWVSIEDSLSLLSGRLGMAIFELLCVSTEDSLSQLLLIPTDSDSLITIISRS